MKKLKFSFISARIRLRNLFLIPLVVLALCRIAIIWPDEISWPAERWLAALEDESGQVLATGDERLQTPSEPMVSHGNYVVRKRFAGAWDSLYNVFSEPHSIGPSVWVSFDSSVSMVVIDETTNSVKWVMEAGNQDAGLLPAGKYQMLSIEDARSQGYLRDYDALMARQW